DPGRLATGLVGPAGQARQQLAAGAYDAAMATYQTAADQATARGDLKAAADLTAERAAMRATYAGGPARPDALRTATAEFSQAAALYQQLGDDTAAKAVSYNLATASAELGGAPVVTHPAAPMAHPAEAPTNLIAASGHVTGVAHMPPGGV